MLLTKYIFFYTHKTHTYAHTLEGLNVMGWEREYVLFAQFNTLMSPYHHDFFFVARKKSTSKNKMKKVWARKKNSYINGLQFLLKIDAEKKNIMVLFFEANMSSSIPLKALIAHLQHDIHEEKNSLNYNQSTHILFLFTLKWFNLL